MTANIGWVYKCKVALRLREGRLHTETIFIATNKGTPRDATKVLGELIEWYYSRSGYTPVSVSFTKTEKGKNHSIVIMGC